MPRIVEPAIAAGTLARTAQPVITVDSGAVLRPWVVDDAPALRDAYQDSSIQRWHVRRIDSLEEARELISVWQAGWIHETGLHWAVANSDDGLLGRVALRGLDLHDGLAELSYWTAPTARGRGLATRAVVALTGWAFGNGGFHRLELEHSLHNVASCRVAEKAGFAAEGVRRGSAHHTDGWHDMHRHGRLQDDPGPRVGPLQ